MKLHTDMQVNQISDYIWEIPPSEKPGMLVPARIYAGAGILAAMDRGVFDQVTNVACLPAFIDTRSVCPTDIGAMVFLSAVSPPSIPRMASSRLAGSDMTSTAACD